jgi:hypothetical protein
MLAGKGKKKTKVFSIRPFSRFIRTFLHGYCVAVLYVFCSAFTDLFVGSVKTLPQIAALK